MRLLLLEERVGVAAALDATLADAGLDCDRLGSQDERLALDWLAERGAAYLGMVVGNISAPQEAVRQARACLAKLPILALLDHRDTGLTVELLKAGADDVVAKPVKGVEIAARLSAINRRGEETTDPSVTLGNLVVHVDGRDPEVDGHVVKLTRREHSILALLSRHAGRVVAKDTVYDAVYGLLDAQPLDKVIDVYICKLRRKLREATGGDHFIETVPGRGYKLDHPTRTSAPAQGGRGRLRDDDTLTDKVA